jgi:hypothetical protein
MPNVHQPLFSEAYLRTAWAAEYEYFRDSPEEHALLARLQAWAERVAAKETTDELGFVQLFFGATWGYWPGGARGPIDGVFTLWPRYAVPRAGQVGGTGQADLALGLFEPARQAAVPQVLCEFKDIRSGLDAPQHRKGNDRPPVRQCMDYLWGARTTVLPTAPALPTWGIVTDMNEFRLYFYERMPAQAQRFVLVPAAGDEVVPLVAAGEEASFQRFLFWKLFQYDSLLATAGKSPLERLLAEQWVRERDLERDFYREYQDFRKTFCDELAVANPDYLRQHTKGRLVRMAQRYLDRCLFLLYCEDMGPALGFPRDLLRNLLVEESRSAYYQPDDTVVQHRVAQIFQAMRDGGTLWGKRINRFNGGLFAADPELDGLRIPTRLFCAPGQGASPDSLRQHRRTLLYLAATYNYGVKGAAGDRVIDLYALGRIFEQSITELEYMEAEADGRKSVAELSKRKRDGVYYTPEWVTGYLVDQTVGVRLDDLRREVGLAALEPPGEEDCAKYRTGDRRFTAVKTVETYANALLRYSSRLDRLRVVDPACGSGAFLIQAYDRLYQERQWISRERERVEGQAAQFDSERAVRGILAENLHGVDINPESVEITKLALWLHTAQADKPLTQLDDNIRCGNSLVGPDFWAGRQVEAFPQEERERVNAFDWQVAFPRVFAAGGFDCVIGNPPYVKLQHFHSVHPDVTAYLLAARRPDGTPRYASTQTGNFDLYLPFIELGTELLRPEGRMGYIAPSLWAVNEYGEGLRRKLRETRRLERWIDFRSYQVFSEAITYTALQFYRGSACEAVQVRWAPAGEDAVAGFDWTDRMDDVRYEALPAGDPWRLVPNRDLALIQQLEGRCRRLDDPALTERIFQGLITSADHLYHLERVGPGQYRRTKKTTQPAEVAIEDELMKPLVSGSDVRRYVVPRPTTYLLFPYDLTGASPRLYSAEELARRFPGGWAWLRQNEAELRAREKGAFDDDQWYRFGRNQNLDKQDRPKIAVAETVPALRLYFDEAGAVCLNNVRANGILTAAGEDAWFLLGILNAPVCNFVFERTAKPKDGGYFEANKQFIAPLPIPPATPAQRAEVGDRARALQDLHTRRRDALAELDRRLAHPQMRADDRPLAWLWADIGDVARWSARAPQGLKGRALTTWARTQIAERTTVHLDALAARLRPGIPLTVVVDGGDVRLLAAGLPLLEVFVPESEAPGLAAQWRQVVRTTPVARGLSPRRLVEALCALRTTDNVALLAAVLRLDGDLEALDARIASEEAALDDLVFRLYDLTPEERAFVSARR